MYRSKCCDAAEELEILKRTLAESKQIPLNKIELPFHKLDRHIYADCPKCGLNISGRRCGGICTGGSWPWSCKIKAEHLHRKCIECNYAWGEWPLNNKE